MFEPAKWATADLLFVAIARYRGLRGISLSTLGLTAQALRCRLLSQPQKLS